MLRVNVAALFLRKKEKKKLKIVPNKRLVKLCSSPSKEYYATIKNYHDRESHSHMQMLLMR